MKDLLVRASLFGLLWWALAEGSERVWWLGMLGVAGTVWASRRLIPPPTAGLRVRAMLQFAAYFIWHSTLAGIQVAVQGFRGPQALHAGMVRVKTVLPAGAPRLLLINLISLMPGTVCVGTQRDELLLHVLDTRTAVTASIASLEARIAAIFGECQ